MSLPEVKRKNVKKADDVKQGIKKGVEPAPENFASGKTQERCRNCRITAINGINFPPGKNTARVNITENTVLCSRSHLHLILKPVRASGQK